MPLPTFVNPPTMPTPPPTYSTVAVVGDLVFVSGQLGRDENREIAEPDIVAQTTRALENLRTALAGVDLTLDHVAKLTIFITHREDLPALREHLGTLFPANFPNGSPTSSLVVVAGLALPDARIEIEAIAHR